VIRSASAREAFLLIADQPLTSLALPASWLMHTPPALPLAVPVILRLEMPAPERLGNGP
jgi:hypothetical protein